MTVSALLPVSVALFSKDFSSLVGSTSFSAMVPHKLGRLIHRYRSNDDPITNMHCREHGCWFVAENPDGPRPLYAGQIRREMGDIMGDIKERYGAFFW